MVSRHLLVSGLAFGLGLWLRLGADLARLRRHLGAIPGVSGLEFRVGVWVGMGLGADLAFHLAQRVVTITPP